MKIRLAVATIAAASLLAVAGCDSRDYDAEIAALEADLQATRSENQQLQSELEELRTQADAQPAMAEGDLGNVQAQLNNALQAAAGTYERLAMADAPDAPDDALGVARADLQVVVQSVQAAAADLGIELETVALDTDAGPTEGTGVEPAAGPVMPADQDEPAVEEEEPGTAEQPAPAQ
jgi:hypothetical protein